MIGTPRPRQASQPPTGRRWTGVTGAVHVVPDRARAPSSPRSRRCTVQVGTADKIERNRPLAGSGRGTRCPAPAFVAGARTSLSGGLHPMPRKRAPPRRRTCRAASRAGPRRRRGPRSARVPASPAGGRTGRSGFSPPVAGRPARPPKRSSCGRPPRPAPRRTRSRPFRRRRPQARARPRSPPAGRSTANASCRSRGARRSARARLRFGRRRAPPFDQGAGTGWVDAPAVPGATPASSSPG